MWRDDIPLRNEDHVHFILNHAALGDTISSIPAIKYGVEHNAPDMGFTVWTPEFCVPLIKSFLPHDNVNVRPLHEFNNKAATPREAGPGIMNCAPQNTMTRNKIDLVQFGFMTLLDRFPSNDEEQNYPTAPVNKDVIKDFVPGIGKYVTIGTGATSDNKVFHPVVLEPLIRHLLGEGYAIVLLGKSTTIVKAVNDDKPLVMRHEYDKLPEDLRALCHDLRDKTSLVDARNIIAGSACFFGVDGGLLHLAGTTDTPVVYGITSVDPIHRGIVRHGKRNWRLVHVTPRNLACAGCQSHWTLMFKHDFRFCAYEDFKCVTSLDAYDFIDAFNKLTKEMANEHV